MTKVDYNLVGETVIMRTYIDDVLDDTTELKLNELQNDEVVKELETAGRCTRVIKDEEGWNNVVEDVATTDENGVSIKQEELAKFETKLKEAEEKLKKTEEKVNKIKSKKSKVRDHNVGNSDYSKLEIQPWDVWLAWHLNPWDADIVKRIARTKEESGMTKEEARKLDYQKIIHICQERIRQIDEGIEW